MAYIEVEIDIESYLHEVSTGSLIDELKERSDRNGAIRSALEVDLMSGKERLDYLKELMGLQDYHTGSQLISEIKDLIYFTASI